jgi:hypothetical protein
MMVMCQVFITPLEFQQFLATSPPSWGIIDSGRSRNGMILGSVYIKDPDRPGYYRVMEIVATVDPMAKTVLWRTLTYLALIESIHRDYTQTRAGLSYAVRNLDIWSRRLIARRRYGALGIQPTFLQAWRSMSSYRPSIHSLMYDYVYLLVHAILRGWRQPIRSTQRRIYSFYDSSYLEPIREEQRALTHEFNAALIS